MKVSEIRQAYLDFFASKGHQIVPSSPVVPGDDPTLLFTNAGMNQFKDVFLGFDKRPYKRATTAQKCIRAGGKHNDLDNVGYTARHHTFFEMLGNFSFGDYFKQDAIRYAWELLTQVFKLPKEKLWVTVYAEDDEAYDIWLKQIGVPAERIVRIGDNKGGRYASDNFWMMGDTGPCGPCTEIFYDHGPDIQGGPPGSPDEDGDRFIEIWNNVFMQFNRDEAGEMHPLPKPSVDTGMGLERIAAVLQHVHSNYQIDLFVHLLKAAKQAVDDAGAKNCDADSPSLKVIADHIRACSFVVVDGVIPGNAGRGYVLRRIARRAIRHGYKLGARRPFFHQLVPALVAEMGDAYPELAKAKERVIQVLKQEEERFAETLENGMKVLESALREGEQGKDHCHRMQADTLAHQPGHKHTVATCFQMIDNLDARYVATPVHAIGITTIPVVEIVIARYQNGLLESAGYVFQTAQTVVQSDYIDTVAIVVEIAQEQAGFTLLFLGQITHPVDKSPAVFVVSNTVAFLAQVQVGKHHGTAE